MVPPRTGNVVKGCIAFCAKASGHPVTESCRTVTTIPHHTNKCSNTTRRAARAECPSPAMSPTGWQRRRVVVLPPTPGIGDIHLVAQHIPHDAGLLPRGKCFDHRHITQFGQPLILGQAPTIHTAEHLLQQLPEFTFTHAASLAQPGYKPTNDCPLCTCLLQLHTCHHASACAGEHPRRRSRTHKTGASRRNRQEAPTFSNKPSTGDSSPTPG